MFRPVLERLDIANSATFVAPTNSPVLEGYVDQNDEFALRQLSRDMYYSDVICGSAVDIYSSMPFGDFSLSGLPDSEMLYTFLLSCEKLRLKSLFPAITIDYLVDGAVCGALNFDSNKNIFDAYIPLNMDNCEFQHLPFFGSQPMINADFRSSKLKIKEGDSRIKRFIDTIPELIRKPLLEGSKLMLNPDNAVFLPRASMSYRKEGVSLFRRLIMFWLIEKALARGTIEMAHRRQRGITHAIVGDGMDWVPDQKELNAIGQAIIDADRDPLGAVIVTRPGVQISNLGSAMDMWKHSDVVDTYTQLKLKGLGFSESLYTGELNVGSADSIMTVFNTQMRDFRDRMVRGLLYERVFPFISATNRFEKDDRYMQTSRAVDIENRYEETRSYNGKRIFQMNDEAGNRSFAAHVDGRSVDLADGRVPGLEGVDLSKFYIPTLNWHNSLRPEASTEYLELLNTLEAKGVPIMMRTLIAASGMSIGDIMSGMDEDISLRKKLADYNKKIKKYMPASEEGGQGGFDNQSALITPSVNHKGLADRADGFEELEDRAAFALNNNHIMSRKGKQLRNERANKAIAEGAALVAARNNATPNRAVPLKVRR